MKTIYLFIIILLMMALFVLRPLINRKLPLFIIAKNSHIISFNGWRLITYSKFDCWKSYYFKKEDQDTIFNFAFNYYIINHKCNYKQGLGDYDLIKEFPSNDSIFNLSITINGDTLYFNRRHSSREFFVPEEGEFIRGRYYFHYLLLRKNLDSCQIKYFEENRDAIIKSGTNDIPEFNSNCELLSSS